MSMHSFTPHYSIETVTAVLPLNLASIVLAFWQMMRGSIIIIIIVLIHIAPFRVPKDTKASSMSAYMLALLC